MNSLSGTAPSFCIIGAQKSGTSWLWEMLDRHPGTSLPQQKEIHYFGSAELYAKGDVWYYDYFKDLDAEKVIGEASTSYFYDRVPFWHNKSAKIEFDESLPPIPELMCNKFPDMKFIVVLRDPVQRAISAYMHWMKKGTLSPSLGLTKTAKDHPKLRILEYGLYAKYLDTWTKYIPPERLQIILFEEQIKRNWDQTLLAIYSYIGVDPLFKPDHPNKPIHKSWGWSRIVFAYHMGKVSKKLARSKVGAILDRHDIWESAAIKTEDIEFLRSAYLPEKERLSKLIDNPLTCWDYGEGLLRKLDS